MSERTPYGYTRHPDTKLLIPDPVKAPVVRRIFSLYADGKLGTTAIARTLDAEAAPSPRKTRLVTERAAADPRQPRLQRPRPLERRYAPRPARPARRRRHVREGAGDPPPPQTRMPRCGAATRPTTCSPGSCAATTAAAPTSAPQRTAATAATPTTPAPPATSTDPPNATATGSPKTGSKPPCSPSSPSCTATAT